VEVYEKLLKIAFPHLWMTPIAHNILIKRHLDKNIVFSSKYSKKIFSIHTEKKYWMKNVFLFFYLFIAIL